MKNDRGGEMSMVQRVRQQILQFLQQAMDKDDTFFEHRTNKIIKGELKTLVFKGIFKGIHP